jgi:hypothetical protein
MLKRSRPLGVAQNVGIALELVQDDEAWFQNPQTCPRETSAKNLDKFAPVAPFVVRQAVPVPFHDPLEAKELGSVGRCEFLAEAIEDCGIDLARGRGVYMLPKAEWSSAIAHHLDYRVATSALPDRPQESQEQRSLILPAGSSHSKRSARRPAQDVRVRFPKYFHRGGEERDATRKLMAWRAWPKNAQVLLSDFRVRCEVNDDAVAVLRASGVDLSYQRGSYSCLSKAHLVGDEEPPSPAVPLIERSGCALHRDALKRTKTRRRCLSELRHNPSNFRVDSQSSMKSSGSWPRLASTR